MTTAPVDTGTPGLVRGGRVISADGTPITYLTRGSGPVLLAVHGGLGSAVSMRMFREVRVEESGCTTPRAVGQRVA
ncbi:hypothetical protein ACIG56_01145 [Nocardia fusca]|uniref:hypothetical protein n=1 Tax=Nocardia fusca TaxID=941183 RepID=UPI0037C9B176